MEFYQDSDALLTGRDSKLLKFATSFDRDRALTDVNRRPEYEYTKTFHLLRPNGRCLPNRISYRERRIGH